MSPISFIAVILINPHSSTPLMNVSRTKLSPSGQFMRAIVIGDLLLFLTTLIIGILASTGPLDDISLTSAYFLIGISGYIAMPWVILGILTRGKLFIETKDLLMGKA